MSSEVWKVILFYWSRKTLTSMRMVTMAIQMLTRTVMVLKNPATLVPSLHPYSSLVVMKPHFWSCPCELRHLTSDTSSLPLHTRWTRPWSVSRQWRRAWTRVSPPSSARATVPRASDRAQWSRPGGWFWSRNCAHSCPFNNNPPGYGPFPPWSTSAPAGCPSGPGPRWPPSGCRCTWDRLLSPSVQSRPVIGRCLVTWHGIGHSRILGPCGPPRPLTHPSQGRHHL